MDPIQNSQPCWQKDSLFHGLWNKPLEKWEPYIQPQTQGLLYGYMFMSPKHHNEICCILKAQGDVKQTSSIKNPSLGWNLGATWGLVLYRRWAPSIYKWIYISNRWPYTWVVFGTHLVGISGFNLKWYHPQKPRLHPSWSRWFASQNERLKNPQTNSFHSTLTICCKVCPKTSRTSGEITAAFIFGHKL